MRFFRSAILLLVLILIALSFTKAADNPIRSCHHWSRNSVSIYANCVNSNFMEIGRRFNRLGRSTLLRNCPVFSNGQDLPTLFTSCVNNNFRSVRMGLASMSPARPLFRNCFNSFGDEVSYSFESCVNRNFDETDRFLPY